MQRRSLALAIALSSFTWLAVLAGHQAAGPDYPPEDLLRAVRADGIRAHMAFLADDLLEGRGTGSRGYQLAAHYIRTQFALFGLAPGGEGGSYFQDVRFRRWKLVPEESWFSISRSGAEGRLTVNRDVVLFGHPERQECTAEGQVAYVGYGVTAPEYGYDDYAGIDVKGKIVLVLAGGPARLPPAPGAVYSSNEMKARNATARGAVGRITAWVGPSIGNWAFSAMARDHGAKSRLTWRDVNGVRMASTPGCAAVVSAETLAGMLEGTSATVKDLETQAAADKVKPFALPIRVSMRQRSQYDEVTSPNVIGILPGSDPKLRDEYVVISAHADHVGIGNPVEGDAIYNGAADNASGTAAMLEIARAMAAGPTPRRSTLFIAVTGEEEGLLGSDYFATHPTIPPGSVAANVNIDGVALFYDFADVVAIGGEHSSLSGVVSDVARRMGLTVSPDPMPEEAFFVRSDHYSFVRQGIPSLMMGEGFKAVDPAVDGRAVVTRWFETRYHAPSDDMTQPLDFQAAAKMARVNLAVAFVIAQAPERPRWNDGDFFTKFAKGK